MDARRKQILMRGIVKGVLIGLILGTAGGYLIKTVPFLYEHKDWAGPALIGVICAVVTVVNLAWTLPESESQQ